MRKTRSQSPAHRLLVLQGVCVRGPFALCTPFAVVGHTSNEQKEDARMTIGDAMKVALLGGGQLEEGEAVTGLRNRQGVRAEKKKQSSTLTSVICGLRLDGHLVYLIPHVHSLSSLFLSFSFFPLFFTSSPSSCPFPSLHPSIPPSFPSSFLL